MNDDNNNVVPIDAKPWLFKKGQSGNPAGVSAHKAAVKQLSREQKALLSQMFTVLVPSVQKALKTLIVKKDISDDNLIKAAKLILEYGIGKPTQVVDVVTNEDSGDFDATSVTPAALKAMAQRLNQAADEMQ